MKKIIAIFLACCMFLAGCSQVETNLSDTDTSSESDFILTDSSEPTPYPISIDGVEIEKSPEKVVSLSPAITEILFEMGYGKRVIGRSDYCDFPENVADIASVGSGAKPDIDSIIKLKPDIVISATAIANKDKVLMENQGIKTLVIPNPTTIDSFKNVYQLLGLAFEGMFVGREQGDEAFAVVSKAIKKAEKLDKCKFVYITATLAVAGGDTFESAVLSAFGENVAESGKGYGFIKDLLLETQPDVIFLNNEYEISDLEKDEVLSELKAVKDGKVFLVDNKYFERPTGRVSQLITELCEEISPTAEITTENSSAITTEQTAEITEE